MTTMNFARRRGRTANTLLMCTALVLPITGCASGSGPANPLSAFSSTGKYDVASDPCNDLRAPLRQSQEYFATSIIQNAVVGAVSGAALGALTAVLSGNDVAKSALIGGGVGVLGGAVKGYLDAKNAQDLDKAALEAAINGDASADLGRLRTFAVAIDDIHFCRMRQAEELRLLAPTLDRAVVTNRVAGLRQQAALDRELMESILGRSIERNDVYAGALANTRGVPKEQLLASTQTYQPVFTQRTIVVETAPYEPEPAAAPLQPVAPAPVALYEPAPTYVPAAPAVPEPTYISVDPQATYVVAVPPPAPVILETVPAPFAIQSAQPVMVPVTVAAVPAPVVVQPVAVPAPVVQAQALVATQPVAVAALPAQPKGNFTMQPVRDDPTDPSVTASKPSAVAQAAPRTKPQGNQKSSVRVTSIADSISTNQGNQTGGEIISQAITNIGIKEGTKQQGEEFEMALANITNFSRG